MRLLLLALVLTACSNSNDGSDDPGPDAGDTSNLTYHHYVIDDLDVPASSAQAAQYGLDLDDDGAADNQLATVVTTLAAMGVDANLTVTRAIDRGETILLARLGTTSFADAPVATFQTYAGADPSTPPCAGTADTTCRRHLDGMSSFAALGTPAGRPVAGAFASGTFTGNAGQLVVRIALLDSAPIDVVLIGSRVRLSMASDNEIGSATLAGAVSETEIDDKVIPAVRDNMAASVARDCTALASPPACGCASGSNGKAALGVFDKSPQDCTISVDEVRTNSLVKSLLAPDVNIDGTMALSLGVRAAAIPARFTAP